MLGVHNMGVIKVYKGHNTVEHAWNLQKFKHNPSVQDSDWRTYFKHNCKLIRRRWMDLSICIHASKAEGKFITWTENLFSVKLSRLSNMNKKQNERGQPCLKTSITSLPLAAQFFCTMWQMTLQARSHWHLVMIYGCLANRQLIDIGNGWVCWTPGVTRFWCRGFWLEGSSGILFEICL